MARILRGSMRVNKIKKNLLRKKDKNGDPYPNGDVYMDIILYINDDEDKYGQIASIVQSDPNYQKGDKPNYIGNLSDTKKPRPALDENTGEIDELPF